MSRSPFLAKSGCQLCNHCPFLRVTSFITAARINAIYCIQDADVRDDLTFPNKRTYCKYFSFLPFFLNTFLTNFKFFSNYFLYVVLCLTNIHSKNIIPTHCFKIYNHIPQRHQRQGVGRIK